MKCSLCKSSLCRPIYEIKNTPVFQNKVYSSTELALNAPTAEIILTLCELCGFVFNAAFDTENIRYDGEYENEQAYSAVFQKHLVNVVDLFEKKSLTNKKMVEIGCGKGYFLEKLTQAGYYITGFDPAYTGDNPYIIKGYFSRDYASLNAEMIILRHVLEHIQYPLEFLHDIGKAVDYNAIVYIEVPSFEWIIQHEAFWDIFYEHCNYFTRASLAGLFEKSDHGFLFNNQYQYIIAHLKDLKTQPTCYSFDKNCMDRLSKFKKLIEYYRNRVIDRAGMAIWGAGAKGVTFANLVDPDTKLISRLVDINPKKQYQYIPKSAHQIIPPHMLDPSKEKDILVMNNNYYSEVTKMLSSALFKVNKLESFNIDFD